MEKKNDSKEDENSKQPEKERKPTDKPPRQVVRKTRKLAGSKSQEFSRMSKQMREKLQEFSEEQKGFFIEHFKNDGGLESLNVKDPRSSGAKTMKNDIMKFFSKVVSNDQKLKKRLEKHRTMTFKNIKEVKRRRRAMKVKPDQNERDSRVEFSKLSRKEQEDKNYLILLREGEEKKHEREVQKLREQSIANKFLYSEEKRQTSSIRDSLPEPETPLPSHFNKNRFGQDSDSPRTSSGKTKSRKSVFSRWLSNIFYEKKFAYKNKKELKNDLKKYRTKLEEQVRENEKKIETLDKKIEKNLKDLKNGVKVFRDNSLWSLLKFYRKLNINKHLRLECIKRVEIKSKLVIEKRIFLIDKAIASKVLPFYVKESFFCPVESFIIQDSEVIKDSFRIRKLETLIPQMEKIYDIERKIKAKKMSKRDLKNSLDEILEHAKNSYSVESIGSFDEYIWQDEAQDQFNKIVRDVRTQEGETISNFLSAIENYGGLKKIPPYEITEYIESFVDLIKKMYKFRSKEKIKIIKQLSDRLFYSLIGYDLLMIEYELVKEGMNNFLRKQTKLRILSAELLGVDTKFLYKKSNDKPYKKAIEVLSDLEYCTTPNDMMWAINCCSKQVINEANETCKKNKKKWSFGADELLPIIIYVIVHAEVPYIQANLSYLSKFGTEKTSEIIYYLTCFEGAVMYIQNVTEEELDRLMRQIPKKSGGLRKKIKLNFSKKSPIFSKLFRIKKKK